MHTKFIIYKELITSKHHRNSELIKSQLPFLSLRTPLSTPHALYMLLNQFSPLTSVPSKQSEPKLV